MLTAPEATRKGAVACRACDAPIPEWRAFCPDCRHPRPHVTAPIPGFDRNRRPARPTDPPVRRRPPPGRSSGIGFRVTLWVLALIAAIIGSYGASALVRSHSRSAVSPAPGSYEPAGAAFHIDFPAPPRKTTTNHSSGAVSLHLTMAGVSNDHGALAIGFTPLPPPIANGSPDGMLVGAVNSVVAEQHGRLTSLSRTTFGGAPAADFAVAVDRGVIQGRVIATKSFFYEIIGAGDAQNSYDYVAFLNSFRLTAQY
jgi:hypothetical protein